MGEREMLRENGTQLSMLRPSSVVATAQADLRRAARNKERFGEPCEFYAFHRKHVTKAARGIDASPKKLIEIALADMERGKVSGKYNTRLLYSDEQLLKSALAEASKQYGGNDDESSNVRGSNSQALQEEG